MPPQRHVCVHGHFYQPPRENPWLEAVEIQDSAHPYHDWNERIARECYAPNAASRVLDEAGRIVELVDNYRRISFNFGPTLLSWMERHAPDTHRRIQEADRASVRERGGHGNAWAQAYNHPIMPLATRRDKETQVLWGIADFQRRFGRRPEGLWLPETAVDTETLNVLIENGVRFTLLSPLQARAVRPARRAGDADAGGGDGAAWTDVSGGRIDPSRPYLWRSPAGGTLVLFFYDAPISRAVAFEGVLNNGERFAERLKNGFSEHREGPQLVHIATDGESYGHHHRFGDMALAYALKKLDADPDVALTNYGEFLDRCPPAWEVEIIEKSSWSCPHGVERWRSDCGCRMGGHAHWNQRWRTPLRDALNELAAHLDGLFERRGAALLADPWRARNAYIDVVLDREDAAVEAFFASHGRRPLSPAERADALALLEMQRHRLLMFTSCAWFFDEISGLESTTVLLSTARALQLAARFPDGGEAERTFLEHLAKARSNLPDFGNGRDVYERFVRPVIADLPRLAAHQALKSAGIEGAPQGRLYAYEFELTDRQSASEGVRSLVTGRLRVRSRITRDVLDAGFAVLHRGGHDFECRLAGGRAGPDGAPGTGVPGSGLLDDFRRNAPDFGERFARAFDPRVYTLQDLLLEERRRLLSGVIDDVLGRFDGVYRRLVDENRPLIDYLQRADYPMPHAFRLALESVLGRDLSAALARFTEDDASAAALHRVRQEAALYHAAINWASVIKFIESRFIDHVRALADRPDPDRARRALFLLRLAGELDLTLTLWEAENLYFELRQDRLRPSALGPDARVFSELAERLHSVP